MVAAVRGGESLRSVASRFHVGLATLHDWVRRAHGQRLDRVEWNDRPPLAHHTRRTALATEDLILAVRRELKASSALGEYGDAAIQRELRERHFTPLPSAQNSFEREPQQGEATQPISRLARQPSSEAPSGPAWTTSRPALARPRNATGNCTTERPIRR